MLEWGNPVTLDQHCCCTCFDVHAADANMGTSFADDTRRKHCIVLHVFRTEAQNLTYTTQSARVLHATFARQNNADNFNDGTDSKTLMGPRVTFMQMHLKAL